MVFGFCGASLVDGSLELGFVFSVFILHLAKMPNLFCVGIAGVIESIPCILTVGREFDNEADLLLAAMVLFAASGARRFGGGHMADGETSFLGFPSRTEVSLVIEQSPTYLLHVLCDNVFSRFCMSICLSL